MNYREGNDLVKERLDRVLCNWTWRIAFSEAKVCALPAVGSDHSLLVLSTDAKMHRKWKTFYFEAYWLQHQNCQGVIDTAWSSAQAKGYNLPKMLKQVSWALLKWSRTTFSKANKQIISLQRQFQVLTNQTTTIIDKQKVTKLKGQRMAAGRTILGDAIKD